MTVWLAVALLTFTIMLFSQQAHAAPGLQTTDTPTPSATPAYISAYTLDSGNTLIVERHWTFGELGIFLAIVANMALYGLHWIYEVTRREAR